MVGWAHAGCLHLLGRPWPRRPLTAAQAQTGSQSCLSTLCRAGEYGLQQPLGAWRGLSPTRFYSQHMLTFLHPSTPIRPAGDLPAPPALSPAYFPPLTLGEGGERTCQPALSHSFHSPRPACSPREGQWAELGTPHMGLLAQLFLSRPTWVLGSISPRWEVSIAHGPGRRIMELEIKGVGATTPDHRHLWGGARSGSSGPEGSAEGWEGRLQPDPSADNQ